MEYFYSSFLLSSLEDQRAFYFQIIYLFGKHLLSTVCQPMASTSSAFLVLCHQVMLPRTLPWPLFPSWNVNAWWLFARTSIQLCRQEWMFCCSVYNQYFAIYCLISIKCVTSTLEMCHKHIFYQKVSSLKEETRAYFSSISLLVQKSNEEFFTRECMDEWDLQGYYSLKF